MGKMAYDVFEGLVRAGLQTLTNYKRGGIRRDPFLSVMRKNNHSIPPFVQEEYFTVLQKNGAAMKDGKWSCDAVPEVITVPKGLQNVAARVLLVAESAPGPAVLPVSAPVVISAGAEMTDRKSDQGSGNPASSNGRVSEVTLEVIKKVVAPKVREFLKARAQKHKGATLAELLGVAAKALGGHEYPQSKLGKLMYLGQAVRPDESVDFYCTPKEARRRRALADTFPQEVELDAASDSDVVVLEFDPATSKLVLNDDLQCFWVTGNVAAGVQAVNFPLVLPDKWRRMEFLATALEPAPEGTPYKLSFSGREMILTIWGPFDWDLKMGRILISGPWECIMLYQLIPGSDDISE